MSYKNAQSKAATAYNQRSTVGYTLRLNIKTDADILAALETVDNVNAFLKKIIREKIAESETGNSGVWENYSIDFYKCPECGYLLNKDCPHCQSKVILPKCDK